MNFARALHRDFVKALNRLYHEPAPSWWKKLLEDPDIFIAVRNKSLNAYFQGCSLAKITFEDGEVCAHTHYKYLLRSIEGSPYIKATSRGLFRHPEAWKDSRSIFARGLDEIATLKSAAKAYSRGTEREFVSKIIRNRGHIIDVEIAFSVPPKNDEDAASTPRIDLAALERTDDGIQLVMYEAKLFQNPELRSGTDQVPVLGQIAQYETVINDHYDSVRQSYLSAARVILSLDGLPERRKACAQQMVDSEAFGLSREVMLIIGNFDNDQKHGKAWTPHRQKLERNLGKSRIFAAKDAKDIGERLARAAPCQ